MSRSVALTTALTALLLLGLGSLAGAGGATTSARAARPPVNVRPPSITGVVQVGGILRADPGRWRRQPRRMGYSYQWQLCSSADVPCTDVPLATDSIYAVRQGDAGYAVRVDVTATNRAGSAFAPSTRTVLVSKAPAGSPVNTLRPVIVGDPGRTGNTLSVRAGTWAGTQPVAVTYRWRRCDADGGSCAFVDETGKTYTLGADDLGQALRVLAFGENPAGTGAALSNPSDVVGPEPAKPRAQAPANVSPPVVSGTAEEGRTLTASSGSWSGTTPMEFSFQWRRCDEDGDDCVSISGATGQTRRLGADDVRHTLRMRVTAANPAGTGSAVSAATRAVAGPSAPLKPVNTAEPRISGTARLGEVLRTTPGSWSGPGRITYTFRWRRCNGRGRSDALDCGVVPGASGTTYVLRQSDAGFRMRSQVIATNAGGSTAAASNPTAVVTARPANTTLPSITGTAVPGSRLTVNRGAWVGSGPITYAYQWLRCDLSGNNCGEIAGQTDTTYLVQQIDVGRSLRVRVTARNDAGTQSAISSRRDVIRGGTPQPPPRRPGDVVPVSAVPKGERLIVAQVRFSPNPVASRRAPITVRVQVTDTRGFRIQGALVFMRATPRVVQGVRVPTQGDGWATFQLVPNRSFPQPRNGYNVQFFVKAYRAGDPPLAGIAGYRLVQVALAGPGT